VITDWACADEAAHVFAYHADSLAFLRTLPDDWCHAIITDPPYGLADHKPQRVIEALTAWSSGDRERVPTGKGFLGREWDAFVPPPAVWDECLRVLKPGGHLAVFAGSRTVDLMGLSIRLAGFDMRDGIASWLYGEGMPKAKGVLKGAHEPILLARKPFRGTVAANVAAHGTGNLLVDPCRVPHRDEADLAESVGKNQHTRYANPGSNLDSYSGNMPPRINYDGSSGRWPTNAVLAHHPDCGPDEATPCAAGCHVALLGHDGRYFPAFRYQAKAPKVERPEVDGLSHPTIKPLGLMQWLVRLLVPATPGQAGIVIDPFAGSGATLEAARLEGVRAVGIERDEHSVRLIAERLGVPTKLETVAS
jgi:DNA modification methylase